MLRIGTCSWKYDSWEGIIYSDKAKLNYLKEYSQHYNTVEVDQWFWSLFEGSPLKMPEPHVVENYAESVPDDFKFTVKLPNSLTLTHYYKSKKQNPYFLSPELFNEFIKLLTPIHNKLGPLMLQFEYMNKEKMPSLSELTDRLELFISKIDRNFQLAIEIRNPWYLNKYYFDFLQRNNLSHVFLQGYFMPPVFESFSKFKDKISNPTIIRLHGPDRKGIEDETGGNWNEIVAPKDDELKTVRQMVEYFISKEVDVFVNVNNHYEGSAPLTIKKILESIVKQS